MSKASAPPAPNYAPIAQADAAAAQQQFQIGEEQLQFGRDQFDKVWPYASAYLDTGLKTEQNQYNNAVNQQQTYDETYKPIEQTFSNQVKAYASPARSDQNAAMAMANVTNSFQAARTGALSNLESYGIDPSQTRFGALDLGTRVRQAAATAAAGTQSRLNTEATGLGLEGEAINIGRGYPGAIAQSYGTSTNAGKSSVSAGNETNQTGAYSMGNPTSYFSGGNVASANGANALNMGFNNALGSAQLKTQQSQNFMTGLGNLAGGALGAAMAFA